MAGLDCNVLQQLYMHCTMSVGSSVPSPTAKSCNYDTKAGRSGYKKEKKPGMKNEQNYKKLFITVLLRWVELYGSDSVCSCCDSSCSSAASTGESLFLPLPIIKLFLLRLNIFYTVNKSQTKQPLPVYCKPDADHSFGLNNATE